MCMYIVKAAQKLINPCRWLAAWSNKGVTGNVWHYLGIYAALGLTSPVFVIIRSFLVAYGGLGILHDRYFY